MAVWIYRFFGRMAKYMHMCVFSREKYSVKLVLLAINDMDIITKDIEIVSVEG